LEGGLMVSRQTFLAATFGALLTAAFLAPFSPATAAVQNEPAVGDDGMYTQPWFNHTSFLDVAEDNDEAKQAGKHLAILFEQKGCPYCREMHRVNLAIPDIVEYIKTNFNVLQLNLWGDREVTDFDGETLSEKKFARKYRVMFTPTILFVDEKGEEVFRMPGYFKPFHFKHIFVYVKEEGYLTEPNFQRWLQARADEMRAAGQDFSIWD
jgi:thioredoxin-related protein